MAEQLSLFPRDPAPERDWNDGQSPECDVPGMRYLRSFLSPDEQDEFIRRIDENESAWLTDLSRRVQQYGWRYDYQARAITSDMRIGPLPDWLQALAQRLYDETGLFERPPEQVIVNEYEPGQGLLCTPTTPASGLRLRWCRWATTGRWTFSGRATSLRPSPRLCWSAVRRSFCPTMPERSGGTESPNVRRNAPAVSANAGYRLRSVRSGPTDEASSGTSCGG